MLKKENGITLVALVVTIIILLILAGVTLGTALSQNGLFSRAKNAANAWKDSEKQEEGWMAGTMQEFDNILNMLNMTTSASE